MSFEYQIGQCIFSNGSTAAFFDSFDVFNKEKWFGGSVVRMFGGSVVRWFGCSDKITNKTFKDE